MDVCALKGFELHLVGQSIACGDLGGDLPLADKAHVVDIERSGQVAGEADCGNAAFTMEYIEGDLHPLPCVGFQIDTPS